MWKNLTTAGRVLLSAIAAGVILGGVYVSKNHIPTDDQPQASTETSWKAPAPESAPAMRSRPAPQPAETFWQKDETQTKQATSAETTKQSLDPIASTPVTDQPRAKQRDKVRDQPNSSPAEESSDPYANLKLDKKGK